jgi:hypothetical protein
MQINQSIENPPDVMKGTTHSYYSVSLLQFCLGICSAFILIGLSLLLWLLGFLQKFSYVEDTTNTVALFLLSAACFLCGLLIIPSSLYGLGRIINKSFDWLEHLVSKSFIKPTNLLLVIAIVLVIGTWVSEQESISWIFLPLFHLLAIALPILLFTQLSLAHLQTGSEQRKWGIFSCGLIMSPLIIIVAETISLVLFGVIVLAYLQTRPVLFTTLLDTIKQIQSQNYDLTRLYETLSSFTSQPWFISSVLIFGAVIVPAIEEFLKPIGMWFLFRHPMTPQLGFTAGVLSGSGYALFESLSLGASEGQWAPIVLARFGTGIIHILTTGLIGWALAQAWQKTRYFNLILAYFLAISIHGIWNGIAIFSIFASLINPSTPAGFANFLQRIDIAAPFSLISLLLGSLIVLVSSNHSLRNVVD